MCYLIINCFPCQNNEDTHSLSPPQDYGEPGFGEPGFGDPFGRSPSTGTSVLTGHPEDSDQEGSHSYAMGPVLKAMMQEWEMGDEVLNKEKKGTLRKLGL